MAKILVVDDSETLRSQLRYTLTGAGHSVVEAFDGMNGLEVLEKNSDIALIFCDLNMPRMDGITMCQKIHDDSKYKKVPIFMLTTESSMETKAKGKEAGITAWLVKPFVQEKLLAAVQKALTG